VTTDKHLSVLFLVLATVSGACGSDPGGGDGTESEGTSESSEPNAGVVEGVVTYVGTETGSLVVGLYDTCPAAGPPIDLNIQQISNPVFPQAFSLDEIDPGDYYVIAALDVGSDDPAAPGPEDKVACSEAFTIIANEVATVNIELEDE
jgi:hypothetical protein